LFLLEIGYLALLSFDLTLLLGNLCFHLCLAFLLLLRRIPENAPGDRAETAADQRSLDRWW
jgi:hypothetical protein